MAGVEKISTFEQSGSTPAQVLNDSYEDIVEVSRHPELFCSGKGTNIPDLPPSFNEFFGSMINMDDPRHARMRRIVSRGFTPRQL